MPSNKTTVNIFPVNARKTWYQGHITCPTASAFLPITSVPWRGGGEGVSPCNSQKQATRGRGGGGRCYKAGVYILSGERKIKKNPNPRHHNKAVVFLIGGTGRGSKDVQNPELACVRSLSCAACIACARFSASFAIARFLCINVSNCILYEV